MLDKFLLKLMKTKHFTRISPLTITNKIKQQKLFNESRAR